MSSLRSISFLCCAAMLAVGLTCAQTSTSTQPTASNLLASNESSSLLTLGPDSPALLAAASPAAQYGAPPPMRKGSNTLLDHLAFEAGGGFTAPTSDSSPYITWGGNFTVGVGYRFNSRLSLLTEFQFIANKLPGALIAETGADGGYAQTGSFTLAPVFDLFPKRVNDLYITGGGGFYRKLTSFTDPVLAEYCDYYCGIGVTNAVVGHFSSNQGGWNIGAGYSRKIAGDYDGGRMKLFAEARYLDVLTPAVVSHPNGLGKTTVGADTKLVPVTFGVRW